MTSHFLRHFLHGNGVLLICVTAGNSIHVWRLGWGWTKGGFPNVFYTHNSIVYVPLVSEDLFSGYGGEVA
jgi:hypothetical protein